MKIKEMIVIEDGERNAIAIVRDATVRDVMRTLRSCNPRLATETTREARIVVAPRED